MITRVVRATSLVLNLLCTFIVPCVESVATKLRVSDDSPPSSPVSEGRRSKRKRIKSNENGTTANNVSSPSEKQRRGGGNGKNIKLFVDITIRQVGTEGPIDIKENTKYIVEDEDKKPGAVKRFCTFAKRKLAFIVTLINMPSTIALYSVHKIRQWSDALDTWENENPIGEGDPDRVKKSPKRRISRANYRKFIPFFPFNLLGFSNYSAFQMPTLTGCTANGSEDPNDLNVSNISANGNGKPRCKRRRNRSTSSSSSSDDFSHLEHSEVTGQVHNSSQNGGHDEVDSNSDEGPEPSTNPIASSSSSEKVNTESHQGINGKITFEDIMFSKDKLESPDSDLDSQSAVAGSEVTMTSTFYQELEEAANQSYNSVDDPEYKPTDSTTESSMQSEESVASADLSNPTSPAKSTNTNETIQNHEGQEEKSPPPVMKKYESSSALHEDDYKTPEEGGTEEKQNGRLEY